VPATAVPRITPEFLAEYRTMRGDWWMNQEFFCSFEDAQTSAFSRDDIDRAFGEEFDEWDL
jgi:hypothetical protein